MFYYRKNFEDIVNFKNLKMLLIVYISNNRSIISVMKRLIVFILLVLLLCGANFAISKDFTIDKIFPNARVEVYTSSKTDITFNKIDNGCGEIIFCNCENLNEIIKNFKNISGFTLKISKTSIDEVLEKLDVKNTYNKNFGVYGCSNIIKKYFNKQIDMLCGVVNFQCVAKGDDVIVGVPILLGGY